MVQMKWIFGFYVQLIVEINSIKAPLYDRVPRLPKRGIPFSWHTLLFFTSVLSLLGGRVPLILFRLTFLALVRGLGHLASPL